MDKFAISIFSVVQEVACGLVQQAAVRLRLTVTSEGRAFVTTPIELETTQCRVPTHHVVQVKVLVFWVMTLRLQISCCRHFNGFYCLHLQEQIVQETILPFMCLHKRSCEKPKFCHM